MKLRVTVATAVIAVSMAALSGCASEDPADPTNPPGNSASTPAPTDTPTATPSDTAAAGLVGDWEIPVDEYVLHLKDGGIFTQDMLGAKDFRSGKYTVEGDVISLVGGDGDTDNGKIVGDTLVFDLGTATRIQ